MLRAFVNAFKIPDLRKKLLFTLAMVAVYRIGAWIPVPGVNVELLRAARGIGEAANVVGIINVFAGGALQQMAVFALGIMPYITASIIMQLLAVVIPKLEALQREGEQGRKKITQYTRYVTVGLAVLQATGLVTMARSGVAFGENVIIGGTGTVALIVITLTAGTALIMWLGELITQRGVGNGMSLLIFVSIISQFPSQFQLVLTEMGPASPFNGWEYVLGLVLLGVVVCVAVVFMEQGQRRIPVQYARRQIGRRSYGGQATYIPLKVNQSGVIPVIFASSLLYLPGLFAQVSGIGAVQRFVEQYLESPSSWVFIATFAAMTIFFAYFYTAIAFNPVEVADNMKRYGGFIPGIRPGRQTAEYLDSVLTRITLPGSLYLATIATVPFIFIAVTGIPQFPLGGVSLLIMVGVGLETMKQIESQLMQRNYEGFIS
ncbi:preprotein translocase subunit SecY [Nitriliruptor alkaliphilus]|uniref:preprotein translocase subunit SecY n=1 Tax=Nitriliruptor alkaliphilus TaxID=427918 RepID=UPI000697C04D|nr:preprotein translocase subunit SecY [Nitriliruptor alkaliphilus]